MRIHVVVLCIYIWLFLPRSLISVSLHSQYNLLWKLGSLILYHKPCYWGRKFTAGQKNKNTLLSRLWSIFWKYLQLVFQLVVFSKGVLDIEKYKCAQKIAHMKDTAYKSKAIMPFCISVHVLNPVALIICILPKHVTPTECMHFKEAFNLTW